MFSMKFIGLDLWRIWLVIFVTILHIYLIYCTVRDYLSTKALSFDPLYGGDWNQGPMGLKLSCLLCSIALLPLIVLSSFTVTGNLANDGHVLGKDIDNNHFIIDSDSKGQIVLVDLSKSKKNRVGIFCGNYKFIKQQFVPISIFLQILSGFCFLIPLPFIEAQKLAHKAVGSSFLWHTDLDFLINPDTEHEDFARGESLQLPMRPAYFNLIFCFSLLSYRYPSVFWKTNRHFSLLFSLLILLISVHILIDYSATSILIRLSAPAYISKELKSSIHPITIGFLSIGGSFIFVIIQTTVFNYGLTQYLSCLSEQRQQFRTQSKPREERKSTDNEGGSNTSSDTLDIDAPDLSDDFNEPSVYSKYSPTIIAILLGCLAMGMKVPLFLQQWRLYIKTGDRLMYINVFIGILLGIVWLITWFGLALKSNWKFSVFFRSKDGSCSRKDHYTSMGGITCSTLPTTSTRPFQSNSILGNTGSPVYATCHPTAKSPTNTTVVIPNHLSNNHLQSEETDLSSCYNYVMLHNANAPSIVTNLNSNLSNYATVVRQNNKIIDQSPQNFVNINGNLISPDELFGSEKSSESNVSRPLTAQERGRYGLLLQDIPDGILSRYVANRYYSMENPTTRRIPIVRSPLLSYQLSAESSPTTNSRRQLNNQSHSKVTFNDQFNGTEPDLISHGYASDPSRCAPSTTLDRVRLEYVSNDGASRLNYLRDLAATSPTLNNEIISLTDAMVDDQKKSLGLLMKLNGLDESNDEDERLCSQV